MTVNGEVIRELGTRVDPRKATIAVDGQRIRQERLVYFAVNKPKGYVSTNNDPAGKPKVVDLLPELPQRVYTVGRLDEQSTGLMILTNDGELANKLAHPKFGVEKLYRVVVAGDPGRDVFNKLTEGVWLAEGKVRAKRVRPVARRGQATVLEMTLAEGKNREVRRMLAKLGHKVMSLTRIAVGPIGLKGLAVGGCRPLSPREVELLAKVASGELLPFPEAADRRPRMPRPSGNAPGSPSAPSARPTRPSQPSMGGGRPGGPGRAGGPGRPVGPGGPTGPPRFPAARAGQQSGPPRHAGNDGGPQRPYANRAPGRPPAGSASGTEGNRAGDGPGNRAPRPRVIGNAPPRRPEAGQGGPPRRPSPSPGGIGRPPRSTGSPARPSQPAPPPGGPPRRRIIGLDLGASASREGGIGGPPGGRSRRPVPRRSPRTALGVKRKGKPESPDNEPN